MKGLFQVSFRGREALNVQHAQDVIAPVPRESVLCLVLFPDELQKTLFPVTCVLK